MAVRETPDQALERWKKVELLQQHYEHFDDLLIAVMEDLLGFTCTDIQLDIGKYIEEGPMYLMVQAQRGQAKTTIAAAYAVYLWIHDPKKRILIISAGDTQATEIANWIIQIINGLPELECMRPDRAMGDRASVEAFDIHYSLKGPEKSPSLACIGITSNMQGKRADLLIADDVESSKNSQTQVQRQRIELLTKDFTSICSTGRILYLGTPQSIDSVYNNLPGRGYDVRIWPGRYPTEEEEKGYGLFLAPLLKERMANEPDLRSGGGAVGDRGKPVDPVILNEDALCKKEVDQGAAYFQLQHMLSTTLTDEQRFPLKVKDIRVFAFDRNLRTGPMTLEFARTEANRIHLPNTHPLKDYIYRVQQASDFGQIMKYHMYIDSAGGGVNADELAWGITGYLAGRVCAVASGGFVSGINELALDYLIRNIDKWKPDIISIEKNFGNGALANVLRPRLQALQYPVGVDDVWESGQKELRIIDILEPMIGSGKFMLHEDLIYEDWEQCQQYPIEKRSTYSLLWQMSRITKDRNSLIHDDRLDALAGSARLWVGTLAKDDEKAVAAAKEAAYRKMMTDPLGDKRRPPAVMQRAFGHATTNAGGPNFLNKLRRKF